MPGLELAEVILAVIIGTLAAIVYSLRVLILMERRVAAVEANIQKMTARVLREEMVIERKLGIKRSPAKRTTTRKTTRKSTTKRKTTRKRR